MDSDDLQTNAQAAATNDRLAALVVLRDSLAAEMDRPSMGGVLPQLSAQYRGVLTEIEALRASRGLPTATVTMGASESVQQPEPEPSKSSTVSDFMKKKAARASRQSATG